MNKKDSWLLSEKIEVGGVYRLWDVTEQEHLYVFIEKIHPGVDTVTYRYVGNLSGYLRYIAIHEAKMLFERVS